MVIILKTSNAVLLCQLHFRETDILIGRIHMHFTYNGCCIPIFPQNFGKCRVSGRQCGLIVPCTVLMYIHSAPQRIPGRCTDGVYRKVFLINHTVLRKCIQIRGSHIRVSVNGQTILPQLVAVYH